MQESTVQIRRCVAGVCTDTTDLVAVEEPLEIQLSFGRNERTTRTLSITMRTPGADAELAAGYLFSESLIRASTDIQATLVKPGMVRVELRREVEVHWPDLERHVVTSSSCGVCGSTSVDRLTHRHSLSDTRVSISAETLGVLPGKMKDSQRAFEQTGGIHAAGLFDENGTLQQLFEDVGRHNAVDKLFGWALLQGILPLDCGILVVSGRASFELVQKALAAGVPIMVAVGAPSSLAVELAQEAGMTLAGFARPESFNIYSGSFRIV